MRHLNPYEKLKDLVVEILELDTRPVYLQREKPAPDPQFWNQIYGASFHFLEVLN